MDINIQDKMGEPQKIALVMNNVEFITVTKALVDYCEVIKNHMTRKIGVDNIDEIDKLTLSFEDSCFLTAGLVIEKIISVLLEAEKSVSPLRYEEVEEFVRKNLAS